MYVCVLALKVALCYEQGQLFSLSLSVFRNRSVIEQYRYIYAHVWCDNSLNSYSPSFHRFRYWHLKKLLIELLGWNEKKRTYLLTLFIRIFNNEKMMCCDFSFVFLYFSLFEKNEMNVKYVKIGLGNFEKGL
jgi:hypothetical protein